MISDEVEDRESIRRMGARMMFLRRWAQLWIEDRGYLLTCDNICMKAEMGTRWIRVFIGFTVAAVVRPDAAGVLFRAVSLPPAMSNVETWALVLNVLCDIWPILVDRKNITRIMMPKMLDHPKSSAFRVFTNEFIVSRILDMCTIERSEYWRHMECAVPSSGWDAVRSSILFMKDVDARDALSFKPSVDNFESSMLRVSGVIMLATSTDHSMDGGDPFTCKIMGRGLKRPRE